MRPVLVLLTTATLAAGEPTSIWPHFRGPDGVTGVAPTGPQALNKLTPVWTRLVGTGYASVTVAGGRAVTVGNDGTQDTVWAFDAATGTEQWHYSYPNNMQVKFGAISTPTIDGPEVLTLSKEGRLLCLDLAKGTVVWERNLTADHGLKITDWGFASSPTVHEGRVVVNLGHHGLAVDRKSGKTLWTTGAAGASYATVIPCPVGKATHYLVFTTLGLTGVDPVDGTQRWQIPWKTSYDVHASAPLPVGNGIFISSGYGTGSGFIDLSGPAPKLAWTLKEVQTQLAGGVLHEGTIYAVNAHNGKPGELVAVDPVKGRVLWKEGGFGQGSVIGAGSNLLVLSDAGQLSLVTANPIGFKLLGKAQLLDQECWTQPTWAEGRVYARNTVGRLVCATIE